MSLFFPPDSLLGRYENLLAEKNSLVGRVQALEAELKRGKLVLGPSQPPPMGHNELDALLQSFESSDVFCGRTECESPAPKHLGGPSAASTAVLHDPEGENTAVAVDGSSKHNNGEGDSTLNLSASGGIEDSSQSGWSSFETCLSTNTSAWDSDAVGSKDTAPVAQEITPQGSDAAAVLQSGTFVIEYGAKEVAAAAHRPKRGPLRVNIPGERPATLDVTPSSPGIMVAEGVDLATEEIECNADVPSRLSTMSAGQISAIINTSEFLDLTEKVEELCAGGPKSRKSAGVSDGCREGKKRALFAAAVTKPDLPCGTPKKLSEFVLLRNGGRVEGSPPPPPCVGVETPKQGMESPRLSATALCEQMMKGIHDMKKVAEDVTRRTGILSDKKDAEDLERSSSTLPLSSTTSVLISSISGATDLDTPVAAPEPPLTRSPTPPPSTQEAADNLARMHKIRSCESNLPSPPDPPSSSLSVSSPLSSKGPPTLRRKSATMGVSEWLSKGGKLRTGSLGFEEEVERRAYSMFDLSKSLPTECGSGGNRAGEKKAPAVFQPKQESKRMYENPLSSSRLGSISPSPCTVREVKEFPSDTDNDIVKERQTRGGSGILYPAEGPLQQFREQCDNIYSEEKGAMKGCVKGRVKQLVDMMETVRPKKVLSSNSGEKKSHHHAGKCANVLHGPVASDTVQVLTTKSLEVPLKGRKNPRSLSRESTSSCGSNGSKLSRGSSSSTFGKIEITTEVNREKTLRHIARESSQALMDRCFSSALRGNRVTLSRRGRIAASQTYGAVTDYVLSQAVISKGSVQFDIYCDRLDGWAFVGIVAANEVKKCRPRGLAECRSSFGWTNDSEFFEQGTYHFEALRELISPGANFQIIVDCTKAVVSFRLARPSRNGGHRCHKRYLVCELENLPQRNWQLAIEWLGTARFELLDVKRWLV